MKWKKWLSFAMSACVAASTFAIPQNVNAADGNMVTDADLKNTKVEAPPTWGVIPNDEQLHYMKEGLAAFCHFGPNTFNNVEWGEKYGTQEPSTIFRLTEDFDAETMVRTAKEAGFSRLILTAKHHDGFCLWASEYTDYDISSTGYKDGKGDILEEISDACTEYNMDMGCYLSPWDIHEDHYGCFGDNNDGANSTGITDYNELYINSIKEICTAVKKDENGDPIYKDGKPVYKYGNNNPERRSDRFVEWWMDGAEGDGEHKQKYKWKDIIEAIRETNPHCQIFGTGKAVNGKNGDEDKAIAATGGIHWIGNEDGLAHDETWAKVAIGSDYEQFKEGKYIKGSATGNQWSVPEADTKLLKNGWFWSSSKEGSLRTMEDLANIYFNSVGHGATLLLNFSPNDKGKVDDNQINRVEEFGQAIKNTFDEDLTREDGVTISASSVWGDSKEYSPLKVLDDIPEGKEYDETYWAPAKNETTGTLEINFGAPKTFDVVSIEEYIQKGQTISSFSVECRGVNGQWNEFGKGSTISSKRLVRGSAVNATAIRINILSANSTPMIANVGVFKADEKFELPDENTVKLPSNLKSIPITEFTTSESSGGTWTFENNNTSAWSNATKKGEATFKFTGTKAYIIGTKDPSHGTMDVYIDDVKVDTVNTKADARSLEQLLYTTPDLDYKEHTVRLVCTKDAIGISEAKYHDGTGIFSVEFPEYSVMEGDTVDVKIIRSAGSKGKVSVSYATPSSGAEQGVNYKFLDDSVTFKEGETSKTITLTTLLNDRFSDGMDFYFTLMNVGEASMDTNSSSRILIRTISGVAKEIVEEVENLDKEVNIIPEELQEEANELRAYSESSVVPKEKISKKIEEVRQLMSSIKKRESYKDDDRFVFPTGEDVKTLEAEMLTLDATNAADSTKYVRIQDSNTASNGKEVNWFEDGNVLRLPYSASKTGSYKIKLTYRSGREEGKPNALTWSGENVISGQIEVYGPNQNEWKTVEFTVEITKAGDGTLVFGENKQGGPVLDKMEIECVDKTIETISITGVSLNMTDVTLDKNHTYEMLIPTITPANATNKKVTFESSDVSVAVVDKYGIVSKGDYDGDAVITVTTEDGSKKAKCNVKVLFGNKKPSKDDTVNPPAQVDPSAQVKPAAVTGLNSVPDKKSIKVNWNKTLNADSYVVKVYQKSKLVGTYNTSTTSIVINKLKKLTAYDVKVAAVNKAGQSSEVILKTGTCPGKVKLKSARKVGSGKVKLTFKKIKGAKGYAIFYKTGKQAYKKAGTTKKTFFTVKKLKKGKKYTFQVIAYIKNGNAFVYGKNSKTKKCKA